VIDVHTEPSEEMFLGEHDVARCDGLDRDPRGDRIVGAAVPRSRLTVEGSVGAEAAALRQCRSGLAEGHGELCRLRPALA